MNENNRVIIRKLPTGVPGLDPHSIAFLADDIVRMRYVEVDGELRKILTIVKMRGSQHSRDLREYEITSKGIEPLGHKMGGFRSLITGVPEPQVTS